MGNRLAIAPRKPIQKHKPSSCTERHMKVYFLKYLVLASKPLKRSEHAFIFLSCFVAFIVFKMKAAISLLISNLYLSPFVYCPFTLPDMKEFRNRGIHNNFFLHTEWMRKFSNDPDRTRMWNVSFYT